MEGSKWEKLESFGLEELRDGFFDPVYTSYEPIHPAEHEIDDHSPQYRWVKLVNLQELRSNWKAVFKYWLATFTAVALCLISPAGKWFGDEYRYFLPLAVLIHHPVRDIGVQLEMSLQSIVGASFGMGYCSLVWYVSTATGPVASNQGGILFLGLFLATLHSHWLRSTYQRLFYFSTSFGIAAIFFCGSSLVFHKGELQWRIYWDFGISYLFGIILSLLICICIFPHTGHSAVTNVMVTTLDDIKSLLAVILDSHHCNDTDALQTAQNRMVETINITLSEGLREFSNQTTFTVYDVECLKELRNVITFCVSPLRVLPINNSLLTKVDLENFFHKQNSSVQTNSFMNSSQSPMIFSGKQTPLPSSKNIAIELDINSAIYTNVLRSSFSKQIYELIREMLLVLESLQEALINYSKLTTSKSEIKSSINRLESLQNKLKRKIYKLDVAYKDFTRTNFFCNDLLQDPKSIDVFLFLRYIRQSAKSLIAVVERTVDLANNLHWGIRLPHYPLERSMTRLSKQCSLDQGGNAVLHYFETKRDVDEAFEKIYNSYTSRHKYADEKGKKVEPYIRAIDHNDFNFHTTQNPLRYSLWKLTTKVSSPESKSAFKLSFFITFLMLPTWLKASHTWYQQFQCWWGPMIFFILTNRRNVATWKGLARRSVYGLFGIIFAFCANVSRKNNPFVVATFAGLIAAPFSVDFMINKNTKSSFTALACFMIIALEPYGKNINNMSHALIWRYCWVTGLSLLIGVALSIPITWFVWSFKTRTELRLAISSLLSHISQSYQSVTDRYLYRDINDDPTDLALRLSNIREVRLYQSIYAVSNLLDRARQEPSYISNFKPLLYEDLINHCKVLLEKVIEARISGQYFQVWENDSDEEITHALLSLRRDSVASVIFVLYIVSNCFRSKNKIPKYLPNPILSRKKLYDFINKFESLKLQRQIKSKEKLYSPKVKNPASKNNDSAKDLEKTHWTEVHGMAFARAYTDFTLQLVKVLDVSREILGEESI